MIEKFATGHKVDAVFGQLFFHVIAACAPCVGELKMPCFLCSEGHALAAEQFNHYVFQPSITDVKSQISYGAVDRAEPREKGDADLAGLCLRLRPHNMTAAI